ncbi:MAG: hypothetical protein M1824_004500 [Vezdaea acicularis]|nr:MAG: hypothetical protein M1824_004500 [Vezdaea acicularis]
MSDQHERRSKEKSPYLKESKKRRHSKSIKSASNKMICNTSPATYHPHTLSSSPERPVQYPMPFYPASYPSQDPEPIFTNPDLSPNAAYGERDYLLQSLQEADAKASLLHSKIASLNHDLEAPCPPQKRHEISLLIKKTSNELKAIEIQEKAILNSLGRITWEIQSRERGCRAQSETLMWQGQACNAGLWTPWSSPMPGSAPIPQLQPFEPTRQYPGPGLAWSPQHLEMSCFALPQSSCGLYNLQLQEHTLVQPRAYQEMNTDPMAFQQQFAWTNSVYNQYYPTYNAAAPPFTPASMLTPLPMELATTVENVAPATEWCAADGMANLSLRRNSFRSPEVGRGEWLNMQRDGEDT